MPSTPTPAAPGDVLGAFPASMPGHQRHVVKLPPLDNEHLHCVELLGGKTLKVDCNRQSMDGHFSPREVPGRNYPYWVFSSKGQVMSTRMGCPPGSDRQQFVSAGTLLVPTTAASRWWCSCRRASSSPRARSTPAPPVCRRRRVDSTLLF